MTAHHLTANDPPSEQAIKNAYLETPNKTRKSLESVGEYPQVLVLPSYDVGGVERQAKRSELSSHDILLFWIVLTSTIWCILHPSEKCNRYGSQSLSSNHKITFYLCPR
jgi:predicted nucleic acid-binding protein